MGKYVLNFEGSLGEYIKLLRKSKKITSINLSRMINKSDSYISHLENGRYKSPDYDTLYEILKRLSVDEDKIEDFLEHFDILSPNRIEWEEKQIMLSMEEPSEEEVQSWAAKAEEYDNFLLEDYERSEDGNELVIDILDENNKSIYSVLNELSSYNFNDGYQLIMGMSKVLDEISSNKLLYNFTIKFFSEKIPSLDEKGMVKVLNTLYKELNRIDEEKNAFGKPKQRPLITKL